MSPIHYHHYFLRLSKTALLSDESFLYIAVCKYDEIETEAQ